MYQGSAQLAVKVSVCCEACGHTYSYERKLRGGGSGLGQSSAISTARANLQKQLEQIDEGNFTRVAAHQPCPECGYVQSWMIDPVRRRKGWQWGLALGFAAYIISIPLLGGLSVLASAGSGADLSCLAMPLIFGLPVVVYFITRSLVMRRYQPNKDRDVPAVTHVPVINLA